MTLDITAKTNSAIAAALSQNWDEAILLNTTILKEDKNNLDATNRLAFAYLKLGKIEEAKRFFKNVLKIDPYNLIAQKNLKRLDTVKQKDLRSINASVNVSPLMFLEEPGKTKIVICVNPAPDKILSTLVSGQEVFLKPKKHSVEIRNESDVYLAALPDDLSFKLLRFIAGGNSYQTVVKGVRKNSLTVLIRELKRGKKFANQPTFSATANNYVSYSQGDTLTDAEKPDVAATGEADDDTEKSEEN